MWRKAPEAETKLLNAIACGDRDAFTRLFYMFHQELGEFVFKLTKSKTTSEEVVQEVFIKIWTNRNVLPGIKSFRAYLFTITRNHTFNALRDETRKVFLSESLSAELLQADDSTEAVHEKEELYNIVEQAVALLPPQQQKVWRMNKEEGLPYRKIAEQLKLSPLTVKRHISLAMASIIRYVRGHRDILAIWGILLESIL